jgi:hypothetical protein
LRLESFLAIAIKFGRHKGGKGTELT